MRTRAVERERERERELFIERTTVLEPAQERICVRRHAEQGTLGGVAHVV